MKKIPVWRGEKFFEAEVDDEDYEFLSKYRWNFSGSSRTAYANTRIPTIHGFKNVSMHRMVVGDAEEDWDLSLGGQPFKELLDNGKTVWVIPEKYRGRRKMTVDHIDGNGLNNTRANLRHLSCAEQVKNRRFR